MAYPIAFMYRASVATLAFRSPFSTWETRLPETPEDIAPPVVAELAFEAERVRNRKGGPRTAYFDPRCTVRRVTS